jgi:pimeloyl-ACP methyl ester carboxylesterase
MTMERTQTLATADGATVDYRTVGSGLSVIVIPGMLSIAADFDTFSNALAENFTVHTIERRGRGRSSPQDAGYCMEIEREDARALQKHTQAAYLFGHSYGGLIALETARNNALVKKIAVYEPGLSVNASIPITWAPRYERLLAQNKRLDAFIEFSIGAGPARARHTPRWLLNYCCQDS